MQTGARQYVLSMALLTGLFGLRVAGKGDPSLDTAILPAA